MRERCRLLHVPAHAPALEQVAALETLANLLDRRHGDTSVSGTEQRSMPFASGG
jgi:hypothetical protein